MMAHFNLSLNKDMFASWLSIFFEIIDSKYEYKLGDVFKQRAKIIAGNFMRKRGI